MRQWELFGITDSDPTWTPPQPVTDAPEVRDPSSAIADFAQDLEVLRLAIDAQDERVPEPAA